MEIYKRIKSIRESKRICQDSIAIELKLAQSQYSRREKGEIQFSAVEIEKIASFLDVKISELYGEDPRNQINLEKMVPGDCKTVSERLIEQYERIIEEKEIIISALKGYIDILKKRTF